jgi:hypothetical protein
MNTPQSINPDRLARRVIAIAMQFNGLREISPNKNFDNPTTPGPDTDLVKRLLSMYGETGWQPGWSHCAAFVDGCYCAALQQEGASQAQIKRFTNLMQLGVMNSARAFAEAKILSSASSSPLPGAIWLARHGTSSMGHAGIVIDGGQRMINTIEANTSKDSKDKSKDREGDWITTRLFNQVGRGDLRTQGFVNADQICHHLSL